MNIRDRIRDIEEAEGEGADVRIQHHLEGLNEKMQDRIKEIEMRTREIEEKVRGKMEEAQKKIQTDLKEIQETASI